MKAKVKSEEKDLSEVINSPAQRAYIMSLFKENPLPTSTAGTIGSTKMTQINDGAKNPHVSLATILKKVAGKGLGN